MLVLLVFSPHILDISPASRQIEKIQNAEANSKLSGAFIGNSSRPFLEEMLHARQSMSSQGASSNSHVTPGTPSCDKWSVVRTNFPLSQAIKQQAKFLPDGWCMVIVGGQEAPPYNISQMHPNVVYLDGAAQNMLSERYMLKLITDLPRDHIGRKNLGYLYAIEHGAKTVWDFSDGVVLNNTNKNGSSTFLLISTEMVDVLIPDTDETGLFNPYPFMGGPRSPCRPRGLPQSTVKASHSNSVTGYLHSIPLESIGVIQSLVNQAPDVDDICRHAMRMPFDFAQARRHLVIVPEGSMTPFNSQATFFYYQSLWMLLLPVSVSHRLSDIWRSFIVQRLSWELKNPQYLVLSPPVANRSWSSVSASYWSNGTHDLHNRSESLVSFLHQWTPSSRHLMNMIEDLWIALYERNFLERQDVALIHHWLRALAILGYEFPEVRQCQKSIWPPFDILIPIGPAHEEEFRNLFLRSLKLFWPKSQTNLVMVLDEEMKNREKIAHALSNWTAGLNSTKIAYNKPSRYYGRVGHDRQQLIMFWADNFTNADMVGFVDTDTLFVTVPDCEDLFEHEDKPVVIGVYGKPQTKYWSEAPSRTLLSLGKREAFRCMSYFPVIIKTKHLKEMREHMTNLHNATHFDAVFSTIIAKPYSQFNIMCNYLWWFHREEYAWHIVELEPGWHGVPPPGQVGSFEEAGITNEMLYPKPRVAIHPNHDIQGPQNQGHSLDFFLRQGYCTYLHTQTSQKSPIASPECADFDKKGYNPNLFIFELIDWQYHPKHREAFQRRQNRFRQSNLCHTFDRKVTNRWKKEIHIAL